MKELVPAFSKERWLDVAEKKNKRKRVGNDGNDLEMECMHRGKPFPRWVGSQATWFVMRGLKSVLYIPHSSEPTCQSEIPTQNSLFWCVCRTSKSLLIKILSPKWVRCPADTSEYYFGVRISDWHVGSFEWGIYKTDLRPLIGFQVDWGTNHLGNNSPRCLQPISRPFPSFPARFHLFIFSATSSQSRSHELLHSCELGASQCAWERVEPSQSESGARLAPRSGPNIVVKVAIGMQNARKYLGPT